MSNESPIRIGPGRTGDFVDLAGLEPHQIDRFLFRLRSSDIPYRSGASGVEVAIGHRDQVGEMLAEAMAFVPDDAESEHADELATLGERTLGFVFDAIVVAAVGAFAAVIVVAAIGIFVSRPEDEDPNLIEGSIILAVPLIASFVLICVATHRNGRTVGKRSASTLVVDFETSGEVSFGQSSIRWVVPLVPGFAAGAVSSQVSAPLVIWPTAAVVTAIIYAAAWSDEYSRGIHDRLARTLVVSDRTTRRGSDQLRLEERLHDGGYGRFGG